MEAYFGRSLVVSGNGATKFELEHDHSKLDVYYLVKRTEVENIKRVVGSADEMTSFLGSMLGI